MMKPVELEVIVLFAGEVTTPILRSTYFFNILVLFLSVVGYRVACESLFMSHQRDFLSRQEHDYERRVCYSLQKSHDCRFLWSYNVCVDFQSFSMPQSLQSQTHTQTHVFPHGRSRFSSDRSRDVIQYEVECRNTYHTITVFKKLF